MPNDLIGSRATGSDLNNGLMAIPFKRPESAYNLMCNGRIPFSKYLGVCLSALDKRCTHS